MMKIIKSQILLLFFIILSSCNEYIGTIEENYELEYGKATIEIHSDALNSNDNVLIIDDLIATGGTALAAVSLVKRLEASVSGCSFIIDLPVLEGNKKISDLGIEVQTLCEFSGH